MPAIRDRSHARSLRPTPPIQQAVFLTMPIELHPAGGSSAGLLTDVHARVIHQRRRPIPGLYASGNAAAATEQGIGYQAGLSLAAAMTFSYLAVRHMLG